ncbi:MAG: glycerol-3-phosphate dehydrogenase/oxidase [Pirellulales bacterium]|nr:glycerol-3-phosphate dehydrogenase/oxidase [Pirellulales bacterium]
MDRLQSTPCDILVIGGGIVGAGIARDAAMRGLRTSLIEQSDFASGTSSRSTRLLHGGIRYLAQGQIGLVREASKEKSIVQKIAPHLCQPLGFIFPTQTGTDWPRWKLSIGVRLYDLLCGRRNFGRSRTLGPEETLELVPGYQAVGLTGSVRYFDGLTSDARLVLDTLRSANSHGATVLNYVQLVGSKRADQIWEAHLLDRRTGETHLAQARCLVNAAGPWSDRIPGAQTSLRLTKGVHLVIDRRRLPLGDAVVIAQGGRILFALPWGERVILGTTDTDYDGPLDEPVCEAGDMHYVLDAINKYFPAARLMPQDVLSTWAGLRPLVADKRGKPSDVSRRHQISMSRPGWWDVTGGKLTTYRRMAEETVDWVVRHLAERLPRSATARTPLLSEQEAKLACGILPPEVSRELVQHFCRNEWAYHLDDVMIRRTSWRHYRADHLQTAQQVADWMKSELNWSAERSSNELERYRKLTSSTLGVE